MLDVGYLRLENITVWDKIHNFSTKNPLLYMNFLIELLNISLNYHGCSLFITHHSKWEIRR